MSPSVFVVRSSLALFEAEGGALPPGPRDKEYLVYSFRNGHDFGGDINCLIPPARTEEYRGKFGVGCLGDSGPRPHFRKGAGELGSVRH